MHHTISVAALLLALPLASAPASALRLQDVQAPAVAPPRALAPPAETFEVVRVVDGDTIHVSRGGKTEKLRLLSVDTEERLELGNSVSATKPGTAYGEACATWAQEFFAALGEDGRAPRVGLRFPRDVEARDIYGRLLCHVILEDGRDFNLLLVQQGKSPYFDKYGYSLVDHEGFVRAEAAARAAHKGIWAPDVNAGGPARPYERLLPWWEARAQAVAGFRGRHARTPLAVVAADDPDALERALEASLAGDGPRRIEVFGSIQQFFDEDDGSRTVLLRSGDRRRAVRVKIPREERAGYGAADLDGSTAEFVQNYVYVAGTLVRGERGFEVAGVRPGDWRRAGPEPVLPEPAPTGGAPR